MIRSHLVIFFAETDKILKDFSEAIIETDKIFKDFTTPKLFNWQILEAISRKLMENDAWIINPKLIKKPISILLRNDR